MKKKLFFIAAVLATCLTACSFFNKDNAIEQVEEKGPVEYSCQVELTGGSGRATIQSPAKVIENGEEKTVEVIWSSSHYDYMLVDSVRYDNEAPEGSNSVFTIPFPNYDEPFTVIGDTTAMSTPHEIEYELTVFSEKSSGGADEVQAASASAAAPDLSDFTYVSSMDLKYAETFKVDYYQDKSGKKYTYVSIGSGATAQYFLIPEDQRFDKTYLVSTSVMDLITSIDAMDSIAFCGTKASDWSIPEVKKAIKDGDILYAGKYSAPDYELLLSAGCNFAIENTMIYHNPQTKEKLEELGIPVMVETSSYESDPLGRLEWIKLYGAIYGKEAEADKVFEEQCKRVEAIKGLQATDKTVAFFSINSNGQIVVRKPGDYISKMIKMAGGQYVPKDLVPEEENALSTMKITTEDFYVGAVDADVLIYNSTIEGEISSIDELIKSEATLADFKAVKSGEVYCLREGYFQKTTNVAEFIEEMNLILEGKFTKGECFFKLKE